MKKLMIFTGVEHFSGSVFDVSELLSFVTATLILPVVYYS